MFTQQDMLWQCKSRFFPILVTGVVFATLLLLLTACDKDRTYNQLMREAKALSSELKPRSHTIDEVTQNLEKKVELKRRAERALSEGKITQAQYDDVIRELRRLPSPY